ncbi:hypothetical protein [uncultured Lactobacillus sp.]|uniref:hypothetical protein n=1 Tax=uncultured Lactobacillus sp. TaxID=153152 RepID=UPI002628B873|nr:hypothetical protein [uncultured Lactobacillus sp.]
MKKILILLGFIWGGGLIVVGGGLPAIGHNYSFMYSPSTLTYVNQSNSLNQLN